ncbi:MAG: DUF2281 domain-containing protein, partial [Flavisolibacter sp.]|nr:DUF2281 domain-containing protein [Flavisolibacter sp.]
LYMADSSLIEKIKQLPPHYQQEVEDFVDFIREKKMLQNNGAKDRSRLFGIFKGRMKMLEGFDDPIEGMEEYM